MKLKEIVRESRETFKGDMAGVPVVGLEHIVPEEILFSEYEIDCDKTFSKAFRKGQVLFGRRRAYQKKAAVAQVDGVCSGDIMVLEAIPEKMEPTLLPFIIQNDKFFEYAIQHSEGGLSPRVKWNAIANYELNLPSLDEQKVLADKLWAVYRVKESYRKLLAATDDMVKAKFGEMFGGKDCFVPLESVCSLFVDGDWIESKDQSDSGIRLIQTGNVGVGEYKDKCDKSKYISEDTLNRLNCTEIFPGDILISRLPEPVGRACILPEGLGRAITAVDCTVVRLKDCMLPSFFIANTFSARYNQQINSFILGTTRLRVSRKNLATIKIACPSIKEQKVFDQIYSQAEVTKASLRRSIESIDCVIKSLINQ